MKSPTPLRIAFYVGYYASGDGIGRVLERQIAALERLDWATPVEIRIFCEETDFSDPRIHRQHKLKRLLADPFFRQADLHVYAFGWHYKMFDTVRIASRRSRSFVFFHGITPEAWSPHPKGSRKSFEQKRNLLFADRVGVASPFARDDLLAFGVSPERVAILPLPLFVRPAHAPMKQTGGPVELLHVARLSPNKGAVDLLKALDAVSRRGTSFHLTIVSGVNGATPSVLEEVRHLMKEPSLAGRVDHVDHIDDDKLLSAFYEKADAIVLPSYHDAYCLPVLEAFAHGCHVIAYDSTNLPHVTNGFGTLVPTGNVEGLSQAVDRFIREMEKALRDGDDARITTDSGPVPLAAHRQRIEAYANGFSEAVFEDQFLDEVRTLLAARPGQGRLLARMKRLLRSG